MKKAERIVGKIGMAALFTVLSGTSAFAGTWHSEAEGWRYQADDGRMVAQAWVQDGERSYSIGADGYMQIGWIQENGNWYFLDTRADGPQGALLTGWQWIDGRCYYLNPDNGGAMAAASVTPDGYPVDASGAWTDENGVAYYEQGKGISSGNAADASAAGMGSGAGGSTAGSMGAGITGSAVVQTFSTSDDEDWSDYSDSSVCYSANDFTMGNYYKMSADERDEMEDAIEEFKDEYITSGMSDFEKEMTIIQWIVENCKYKRGEGWENATAYSCIVNGEAQCAGYADAFLQMAKSCGLKARYVSNSTHAWNLIQLEGDWYHVDVTWEDPLGSNCYGFGDLRNKYINLKDSQIREIRSHKTWSPDSVKAKGSAYGYDAVAEYMKKEAVERAVMVAYTIHFIDTEGNEVAVQSGSAAEGTKIMLDYPENYKWVLESVTDATIRSGVIYYTAGRSITIRGQETIDIDVPVKAAATSKKTQPEAVKKEETKNAETETTAEKVETETKTEAISQKAETEAASIGKTGQEEESTEAEESSEAEEEAETKEMTAAERAETEEMSAAEETEAEKETEAEETEAEETGEKETGEKETEEKETEEKENGEEKTSAAKEKTKAMEKNKAEADEE